MNMITIAGAAINQTPIDWKNNLANIKSAIGDAKNSGVDILCLPELCITGYNCEDLFLSEWVPETAFIKLLEIKQFTQGISVSVGLPIRVDGELFNCACLISDKQILGFTPKQFLANDGVHYEHRWFQPGKRGELKSFVKEGIEYPFGDIIYKTKGIRVGFEICEDGWRGNQRPGYDLHKRGIDLILNPSASPFSFGKSILREDLVNHASQEFDCAYVYANLLGNESGRLIFDGEVFISLGGKIVQKNQRFSFKPSNLVAVKIDFDTRKSITPGSIVEDPRDKNEEFAAAVSLGLFDYLRKSRSQGFVLSLSGGADSSCCAVMVSEMVKRGIAAFGEIGFCEQIRMKYSIVSDSNTVMSQILTCAYQGTKNSTDDTFVSAQELALSLGATFYSWEIDDHVEGYTSLIEQAIGRNLTWEKDD
ncbi:MAG: NAD+ synthetase, partial [Cytophagales bacterium]|nr:NAD+ synthetase [Cytophagales bacterium]